MYKALFCVTCSSTAAQFQASGTAFNQDDTVVVHRNFNKILLRKNNREHFS